MSVLLAPLLFVAQAAPFAAPFAPVAQTPPPPEPKRTLTPASETERERGPANPQGSMEEPLSSRSLPPPRERTSVLELTLAWQTQFLDTDSAQGKATAYSLVGYSAEGAFCPYRTACVTVGTASNLNASSGGRILTGVSLGAQSFLVGQADPPPDSEKETHGARPARMQSIWRVALAGAFCQKDYDFKSLYGSDSSQIYIGARPELEGSFWCAQGTLSVDYLFRSGHRVGVGIGVLRSLKAEQAGLKVQGYSAEVRYQILRF